MVESFPVLSVIIFLPIVAAVIILFMDAKQRDLIRGAFRLCLLFLQCASQW